MSWGPNSTKRFKPDDVVNCMPFVISCTDFPIPPIIRLEPSFTYVQEKVQPNKGLEEARISLSPVSDTTTRPLYDSVVVYHLPPRRLLQNFNNLSDFALGKRLSPVKNEFHYKRVLEKFETANRGTFSGTSTSEHALHRSEVISHFPHRRMLAEFSVPPTADVFTPPGSINVQFSDEPGNISRKKASANSIFSSAWSKLRAEVPASPARSDVVGAPPAGGPYVRVCVKHWLAAPPFPVATSPRWRPPVSVCPETAAPLRRPLIPFSAACRLLLSGTATSARGRLLHSSAHGVVTSTCSWDQLEPASDSGLPPFQDFSLFHLLVFDSCVSLLCLKTRWQASR